LTETLLDISQLAVAIAGSAAIVEAIGSRDAAHWNHNVFNGMVIHALPPAGRLPHADLGDAAGGPGARGRLARLDRPPGPAASWSGFVSTCPRPLMLVHQRATRG
jgi:hypothetical protein